MWQLHGKQCLYTDLYTWRKWPLLVKMDYYTSSKLLPSLNLPSSGSIPRLSGYFWTHSWQHYFKSDHSSTIQTKSFFLDSAFWIAMGGSLTGKNLRCQKHPANRKLMYQRDGWTKQNSSYHANVPCKLRLQWGVLTKEAPMLIYEVVQSVCCGLGYPD